MTDFVISLCDESGEWSRRFAENSGMTVLMVDPKHAERIGKPQGEWCADAETVGRGRVCRYGMTVAEFNEWWLPVLRDNTTTGDHRIHMVIAQSVCTQFSGAGARHWKRKDREQPHLLAEAKELVSDCLHVVATLQPRWWVMENPVGRMGRVCGLGKPVMTYQPHEYAHMCATADERTNERYTKRTCLWGHFRHERMAELKGDGEPIAWDKGGNTSKMHALYGGKSDKTKEIRSKTPAGFSEAFWLAHG